MEQLDRVKRYLKRIRDIYNGCPHKYDDPAFYEDDVVSFFIHCHHLMDWVAELNRVGSTKADINKFINSNRELMVCADLCNGEKHCRVERVRTERQPHIVGRTHHIITHTLELGEPVTFKASYRVMSGNDIYDVLELAEKCMTLWRGFVRTLELKVT